ncbi:MAG: hypothetical protein ABS944_10995 [Solibacillus sp.]|uniref:hypothetical protein n=1 Tax=unclassified Solibacillus TaxID=2637870 RepID=UPI0030FCB5A8
MKDEWKDEKVLVKMLDQYEVKVPIDKLAATPSKYLRFIRYLTSPAKDPLDLVTESVRGYQLAKLLPLGCGLFLAILQGILFL